MIKKYTLHVSGTSCNSCKMFIEGAVSSLPGVERVSVDIHDGIATIESNETNESSLLTALNESMEGRRYRFSFDKTSLHTKSNNEIWLAIRLGLLFLVIFFLLQKSSVLSFGFGGKITYTTSFFVGLVASLSSCLAVVGGLVLSLSAEIAKDGKRVVLPITLFHTGRIIGFAILGGVLGLLGDVFSVNYIFSSILGLLASLVMMLLGFNLLGVLKNSLFTLPTTLFSNIIRKDSTGGYVAPLLLGAGTFFLPCGFTQSMQVAALSSGSFMTGLFIMVSFALGTFPVLALLSFGVTSIRDWKYSSLFFKSVGVIVFLFGFFGALSLLAGLGIISPLFSL